MYQVNKFSSKLVLASTNGPIQTNTIRKCYLIRLSKIKWTTKEGPNNYAVTISQKSTEETSRINSNVQPLCMTYMILGYLKWCLHSIKICSNKKTFLFHKVFGNVIFI